MKDAHGSLSEEQGKYLTLLQEALMRFYKEDAVALFGNGEDGSLGECAMVGCVSRYVWCGRQHARFDSLLSDVDTEYNKDHETDSQVIDKRLVKPFGCSEECVKVCWEKIEEFKKSRCKSCQECVEVDCEKKPKFRPDLIVHKRGPSTSENDGMIVEFKKDAKNEKAISFDLAKLRYCTCDKAGFGYKIGVFVFLNKERADVFVFDKGQAVDAFSVTHEHERVELDETKLCCKTLKELVKKPE